MPNHGSPYADRGVRPPIEETKDFFRQLRWILEQKHVANQEVILIEHTTAWLVEPSALPGIQARND
jgi:hypothetical protein